MDVKLTLKLDRTAILRAKRFADLRRVSISRLVEGFFNSLAGEEDPAREVRIPPGTVVARLLGTVDGVFTADSEGTPVDTDAVRLAALTDRYLRAPH